jgi:hypothetical protein
MDRKEADRISENIADIIWWLKGYIARQPDMNNDLNSEHIESLRRVRIMLLDAPRIPHEFIQESHP